LTNISLFAKNFSFWLKVLFFWKKIDFQENFDFRPIFRSNISIEIEKLPGSRGDRGGGSSPRFFHPPFSYTDWQLLPLFDKNFDYWPKFRFLAKFRFLDKISIFGQNFDVWKNFVFRPKFRFWANFDFGKISILGKFRFWANFDFGQISMLGKFRFWAKFLF